MMGSCCGDAVIPFVAMVAVEIGLVGLYTLSKAAMSSGLMCCVFVTYYYALGTLIHLPCFIFQRFFSLSPKHFFFPILSDEIKPPFLFILKELHCLAKHCQTGAVFGSPQILNCLQSTTQRNLNPVRFNSTDLPIGGSKQNLKP
ncbi:hypothetical protein FRX31_003988 [Thalictrum thalictroides]|uniref:Uncharacterized protein n=1 Tax=Thalictrum thalictroides TaxID=46969 RepID=A0A7J6XBT7_THATH|nr:hypothetical protein FRX31_003988 [Thalictrum thalictroides]